MGRAQGAATDRFVSLFGSRRGTGHSSPRWPPKNGEVIRVTLGSWEYTQDPGLSPGFMSGKLWCEDRGLEGWVDFRLLVNSPSRNKELDALIRAVTVIDKRNSSPGSFWDRTSIRGEVKSLAELMAKTQIAVSVRVDGGDRVSVTRWHRKRA